MKKVTGLLVAVLVAGFMAVGYAQEPQPAGAAVAAQEAAKVAELEKRLAAAEKAAAEAKEAAKPKPTPEQQDAQIFTDYSTVFKAGSGSVYARACAASGGDGIDIMVIDGKVAVSCRFTTPKVKK